MQMNAYVSKRSTKFGMKMVINMFSYNSYSRPKIIKLQFWYKSTSEVNILQYTWSAYFINCLQCPSSESVYADRLTY